MMNETNDSLRAPLAFLIGILFLEGLFTPKRLKAEVRSPKNA
jgi:hypothetical protein